MTALPVDPDETISSTPPRGLSSRRPKHPRPTHEPAPTLGAAGEQTDPPATAVTLSTVRPLADHTLYALAAGLDDLEAVRKAQDNRLLALTTGTKDGREYKDGLDRAGGLAEDHPAVVSLRAQLDGLKALEHQAVLALQRQLRTHPLWPWIKAQHGLGPKTVARLLATVGDPYWNDLHDRPRTVGELFAFCGVAGPGYKRVKGRKQNWSGDARMRLWNIAQPIIKVGGPYRAAYDDARVYYQDAVHTEPCAQCGPAGKPAQPGSDLRDGHKHARAVRKVMREVLRDLWTEARRIHEQGDGHMEAAA